MPSLYHSRNLDHRKGDIVREDGLPHVERSSSSRGGEHKYKLWGLSATTDTS